MIELIKEEEENKILNQMQATLFFIFFSSLIYNGLGQTNQGYIDFDNVIENMPKRLKTERLEYREAANALTTLITQSEDSLLRMQNRSTKLLEHIPCNSKKQSSRNYINDYLTLESEIEIFYTSCRNEIEEQENTIKTILFKAIRNELTKFCFYNHIDVIADKKSVYRCLNCKDYTSTFIQFISQ